jgi:exosortase A-associated hydrolase 1
MSFEETAVSFSCDGNCLYGVLSLPGQSAARGLLVVVGGPQYRAGSHRQFTLLARSLALRGIPVMRFDYRGMGDSEGDARGFTAIDDDLRAAIDQFMQAVPSLKEVVIWGLCDAASAALLYACRDRRVSGLVLLNPWVSTEQGIAKTYLKHYYLKRLFDAQLWRKIASGRFEFAAAGRSFFSLIGQAFQRKKPSLEIDRHAADNGDCGVSLLPERMLDGFARFSGKLLLILSGNDLTAQEFSDLTSASGKWRELLASPNVTRHELAEANHTFSRRNWRTQVETWTADWMKSW